MTRPTRPRRRAVLAGVAAVLVALALAAPLAGPAAGGDAAGPNASRVLVVSAPALRWTDLAERDLPNIEAFLARSTVAMVSLRTVGARTSLGEGYATIGAGNRATVSTADAGLALEPREPFEEGTAAQAYQRRTDEEVTGALLHLDIPDILRRNDRLLYGAEPGALGQALVDAGRTVGVIANADLGAGLPADDAEPVEPSEDVPEGEPVLPDDDTVGDQSVDDDEEVEPDLVIDGEDEESDVPVRLSDAEYGRAAALALMDRTGQVARGEASGLLRRDPAAPYGVRLDEDAVVSAFRRIWSETDVAVVELSDLDRTDTYRSEADGAAAERMWADALAGSDELFGRLLDEVDAETRVVLVSPSAPRAAESLGVFGTSLAGDEGGGLARSAATRRAGYVTLTDMAPTILSALDVDVPSSMTGTLISRAESATVDDDLFASFAGETREAIFRNEATGPVSVVFVVAQIVAYLLAAVAVARRRRWTRPVSYLALGILATPPVVFLSGLLHIEDAAVSTFILGIAAAAVALAALAEGAAVVVARRWPRTRAFVAPLLLIGLGWLVLAVDIVTGGGLQLNTVFGYSPIVAGRFAGFGNLAFALIAMSAAVVAAGGWAVGRLVAGRADGAARAGVAAVIAMSTFLAVTVVLDGAPMWGSDVGGVLAAVPSFAILVLVARGTDLDWRKGAVIVGATAVVISVFAALDLSRAEEDRTHLGRLVARVADSEGSGGGLGEVLTRKINSNIGILTSSVWTLTIPAALGLMVFLARRRTGFLRDLQDDVPGIRALLAGGLLLAFLGFALNDSGVAVPAMMFAVLLPFLTYVLLRWDPARR